MFAIADKDYWVEVGYPAPPPGFSLAGQSLGEGIVAVYTGMFMGPAEVTVEFHDKEPTEDTAGWEDVEEVALLVPSGRVLVLGVDGIPEDGWNIATPAGCAVLRVRVHARGRDEYFDDVAEEVSEHYLFQLWPIPAPLPPRMVKHESDRSVWPPR